MPSGRFSARETICDAARVLYDRARSARPSVRHFGLNRSFPTRSRRRVERRIRGAGCGEGVDACRSYCTALRPNFAKNERCAGEVIAHRSPAQRVIVRMAPRLRLHRAGTRSYRSYIAPPPPRQAARANARLPPGESAPERYRSDSSVSGHVTARARRVLPRAYLCALLSVQQLSYPQRSSRTPRTTARPA